MKNSVSLAMISIALGLAACGGGGGGGDSTGPTAEIGSGGDSEPPIQVTLTPSLLTAAYISNNFLGTAATPYVSVNAVLSRQPSDTVYPVVVADSAVLLTGPQPVFKQGDGSYTTRLTLSQKIPAGTYRGVLTLKLCKDTGCLAEYPLTGATVPYKFDVTDALRVTMKINGVPVENYGGNFPAIPGSFSTRAPSGSTLALASNIPVKWTYRISGYNSRLTEQSVTSTSWQGLYESTAINNLDSVSITATPIIPAGAPYQGLATVRVTREGAATLP